MIEALLEREELDPDVERFVNIQEPTKRNQTALHLAVDKRCYASASALLKAGSYQLKLDGANLTPDLESLFIPTEATKITDSHVRGILMKKQMKLLTPQDFHKEYLSQEDNDGKTILSRLSLTTSDQVVTERFSRERRV